MRYHLFIDFKAAYDGMIARVKLYDAMGFFGNPAKLIRLVKNDYDQRDLLGEGGLKTLRAFATTTVLDGAREGHP